LPGGPAGLGVAAGSLWVGNVSGEAVYRIDPATNRTTRVPVGRPNPAWIAARDDQVWVGSPMRNYAVRIDPATNDVVATIEIPGGPGDGSFGPDGLVWMGLLNGEHVVRIDPATNRVVDRVRVGTSPFVVARALGDMWAPSWQGADVWRLRP
jgi:streptogramin lyase